MEISLHDWLRVGLIYGHLIFCIFAISKVIQADLTILKGSFSRSALKVASQQASWLLAGLWATGLAVTYLDTGFDFAILATNSKLLFKLLCVAVLTINGIVLHNISFPVLVKDGPLSARESALLAITGTMSTSHWLMAAFVGVSKPVGILLPEIMLRDYLLVCAATISVALFAVFPMRHHLTNLRVSRTLKQLKLEKRLNRAVLCAMSFSRFPSNPG